MQELKKLIIAAFSNVICVIHMHERIRTFYNEANFICLLPTYLNEYGIKNFEYCLNA